MGGGFYSHWYLHSANILLAVLGYLLIVRALLSLAFDAAGPVMRPLRIVSEPILAAARFLTPRIVPGALVVIFAIVWLSVLRIGLLIAATLSGVRLLPV